MVLWQPPSIAVVTAIRIPNKLMPSEIVGDVVVPNKNGGLIIITTPMKTIKAKKIFQRLCR